MADNEYKTKIVVEGDISDAEHKLENLGKTKIAPVEITVAINDEAVKKRLAEIAEANRLSMSNAGFDQKNGEKFKIEFLPNDAKVKKALREVTASKHTVIVGMRAKWDDAKNLYKELQKPVQIPVVEKRDPPKKVEHPEETVVVREKRIPETPAPSAAPQDRQTLERSRRLAAEMRNVGDAANASAKKAKGAFFAVTGSINRAFYALRAFQRVLTGMSIVTSIMIVYNAFKALKAKIDEISTAAARLRWDLEMKSAAAATASLVGFHERLAALLKEENDTLAKQKSLRDMQQQADDDLADGKRAAARARRLYDAKTPEDEQRLRDQFADEDAKIAAARKNRERKNRIRDLEEEESANRSKANGLRENNKQIASLVAEREFDRRRAKSDEDKSEIDEQLKALRMRKEANDAEIALYEKEARFRRDQIAILENQKPASETDTEGYWNRKAEQKKRDEEARKAEQSAAAAQAGHEGRLAKARNDAWYDREYKNASTPNKYHMLQGRENAARDTFEKLEKQIAEELAKATPDQDKLSDMRSRSESAQREMLRYRAQQEDLGKDSLGSYRSSAERSYALGQVSQNRLTALGLGSGVSGNDTVATEMRKVIDILEKQLAATKENKPEKSGDAASFTE